MVSDAKIEKYARENMGYTGKITPYIKARIVKDMEKETDEEPVTKQKSSAPKTETKKSKTKSETKKGKSFVSTISRGIGRTGSFLGECGERYKEYYNETPTTKTKSKKKPKAKPKVKAKSKAKPKSKAKAKATPAKRKSTTTAKSMRNTQRDFEDEIMGCM